CVFARLWGGKYICSIKKSTEKHKQSIRPYQVEKDNDPCEYFIKRHKFCAESYGKKAILYYPQKLGVEIIGYKDIKDKVEQIKQKLKLKFPPEYYTQTYYHWTFSTSRDLALQRNELLNNGRYVCGHCKKVCKYDDDIEVHHIIERTFYGSDSPANLIVLCKVCHDIETLKLLVKISNRKNKEITQKEIFKKIIRTNYLLWSKRLKKIIELKETIKKYPKWFSQYYKNGIINYGHPDLKTLEIEKKIKFWKKQVDLLKESEPIERELEKEL
ncbi:unnamed protein product, partial [marine sediment metagenome]